MLAADPYTRRKANLIAASAMGPHVGVGDATDIAFNNIERMSPDDAYGISQARISNIAFEFVKPTNVETGAINPGDKLILEIDKRYLSLHRLAAIIYTHGQGWRAHGETLGGIDPNPIPSCKIYVEFPSPEVEE